MIPRYERSEISKIWTDKSRFTYLFKAELAILSALENAGRIPQGVTETTKKSCKINPNRIYEIEAEVHHDVIAFTTSITEQLPTEIGKYFHFGVTSSDILDTALSLQIQDSLKVIIADFESLFSSIEYSIEQSKEILTLGRSHGMYAEPLIMAQKWLSFYAEFKRRHEELVEFSKNDLHAQFSGAVGNYTILSPELEELAAKELGLPIEPLSTQVIPRDYIAKLVGIIAQTATTIERMAVEIRHLQHSDVGEVFEGFAKKQKGSSTMPHKKNPISSENLTGMARLLRSHVSVALENCLLWHERDISHSSNERIYLPDSLGLISYSLDRLSSTIRNLVYKKESIENKVQENSNFLSSYYLHFLIENSDLTREQLYRFVQEASFNGAPIYESLTTLLKKENIDCKLPKMEFDNLKDHYISVFNTLYTRVRSKYKKTKA